MRAKLQRFMMGRYGVDQFSRFLNILVIVLLVVSLFVRNSLVYYVGVALLIYAYFRMFSRNHAKRYAENQRYLRLTAGFRGWYAKQKSYAQTRKTHHIYACPSCRQKIRIPKGKGRIAIRCPKCSTEFIKKS
ncbi:MAG: hypothetical protein IJY09_09770 [Lachnospiraceae bacterium]|nr:hypothetical protein [Lachnospiraceae bacterium]